MAKRKSRIGFVFDGRICDYGCGRKANYQFNNGKVCCSVLHIHCSASTFTTKGISFSPWNKKKENYCKICGKLTKNKIYCSHKCQGVDQKGKKRNSNNHRRVGLVIGYEICDYGCKQQAYYILNNDKFCCNDVYQKCPEVVQKHGRSKSLIRIELMLDSNMVCEYCGKTAYFRFKNGTYCCSSNQSGCPVIKKKQTQQVPWNKGQDKNSNSKIAEIGQKISKAMETATWNRGLTKDTDSRIALHAERISGNKNPMKRPEIALQMSERKKGWNPSSTTRKRMRVSAIKRIEKNLEEGIQLTPGYNINACNFFEQLDKDFNMQGQYATNGGEFSLKKELGYWLDYINFDLKIIIEWDEKYHYDINGNLKERDIQRQEEIQEYFPDFLFLRIREEKFQKEDLYESIRKIRRQE